MRIFKKREKYPEESYSKRNEDGKYRCGYCGFEGYCYGVPHTDGVSAPFCGQCGKNNKLKKI